LIGSFSDWSFENMNPDVTPGCR